ncbi:MAG: hypothetical protein ACT4OG_09685 [Alphaproteobacteria bacterium]
MPLLTSDDAMKHPPLTQEDFKRPPPEIGSDSDALIYQAIGHCIAQWSPVEEQYDRLFGALVNSESDALSRALGQLTSFYYKTRLIRSAAELVLRKHAGLLCELDKTSKVAERAIDRRNDVAHGQVVSLTVEQVDYKFVVIPTIYSKNTSAKMERDYIYGLRTLNDFAVKFFILRWQTYALVNRIACALA